MFLQMVFETNNFHLRWSKSKHLWQKMKIQWVKADFKLHSNNAPEIDFIFFYNIQNFQI